MTRRHSDDDPLDLQAVAADDTLVESLRRSVSPESAPADAVVWGDDEDDGDDPSYTLLRALQLDVSADLPTGPVLPAETEPLRSARRSLGRTATVAAVTAGVLSLAGVAAAASSSPVRSAVADAVSSVVHAITPSSPAGSTLEHPSAGAVSDTATATVTPPGQLVRDAARAAEAASFIRACVDRATALTGAGQYVAAANLLDAAEARLPLVSAQDRTALSGLIDDARAKLAAARDASPVGGPAHQPTERPTAKPAHPATRDSGDRSGPAPARGQAGHGPAATTPTGTRSLAVTLPTTMSTHAAEKATQGR